MFIFSAPTTKTSAVDIGATSTKTKGATKTVAATTTVLSLAGSQCTNDNDCAGAR